MSWFLPWAYHPSLTWLPQLQKGICPEWPRLLCLERPYPRAQPHEGDGEALGEEKNRKIEWGMVAASQPGLSSPACEQSPEKDQWETRSLLLGWALSPCYTYTSLPAGC